MDVNLQTQIRHQNWKMVSIMQGLPEGTGLFAKTKIAKNKLVCNYGGVNLEASDVENIIGHVDKCNYLVELKLVNMQNKSKYFYLNHTSKTTFSFGKYANHSSIHPLLKPVVYISDTGNADIIFVSKEDINVGDELTWDYGKDYIGVKPCVNSCQKCQKKKNMFVFF